MADLSNAAPVPAHKDPNKASDDFVALNKSMRACYVCRLVKSERQVREASPFLARLAPLYSNKIRPLQFFEEGCNNCTWLDLAEDRARVSELTTPNFSG